jgi:tRNA 2-thiouridine synthesizing protein A
MATASIGLSLDLKGLSCPLPIAKTAKAMRDLEGGTLVEVLVTDPGSVADFKAWSTATGNPLVESSQDAGVYRYVIRKKEA